MAGGSVLTHGSPAAGDTRTASQARKGTKLEQSLISNQ